MFFSYNAHQIFSAIGRNGKMNFYICCQEGFQHMLLIPRHWWGNIYMTVGYTSACFLANSTGGGGRWDCKWAVLTFFNKWLSFTCVCVYHSHQIKTINKYLLCGYTLIMWYSTMFMYRTQRKGSFKSASSTLLVAVMRKRTLIL